jgi:hypothetical protein
VAISTSISLEEYLHTIYEPDCEWFDGEIKQRGMPDGYHGYFQGLFLMFFARRTGQRLSERWRRLGFKSGISVIGFPM